MFFLVLLQKLEILLLALATFPLLNAYKILYMVPFPAPSHWMWLRHFSDQLLKRGHEVSGVEDNFRFFAQFQTIISSNQIGHSDNELSGCETASELHRSNYRPNV